MTRHCEWRPSCRHKAIDGQRFCHEHTEAARKVARSKGKQTLEQYQDTLRVAELFKRAKHTAPSMFTGIHVGGS